MHRVGYRWPNQDTKNMIAAHTFYDFFKKIELYTYFTALDKSNSNVNDFS